MELDELPKVMKVKEIKDFLRIGRRQAYELVKREEFPAFRIGNTIRVTKEEFIEWLKNRKL